MSESPENNPPSVVDRVRDFIQQAFENQIDLGVRSNRDSLIKQFKETYPKENQKTISTLFGKELPKIAIANNIDPAKVKQKPAKQYTKDNDIKINPKLGHFPLAAHEFVGGPGTRVQLAPPHRLVMPFYTWHECTGRKPL